MVGSLRLRLFATLLVPVSLTVLLACVASYNTLQSSYRTLLGDRLAVVAGNLSTVAEDNDSIGQPLATQLALQRLLEQAKAQNSDIATISAFLEDGRVVFDTDPASIGERIPASWLPGGRLGLDAWSQSADNGFVVGSPVVNSFRRPLGGMVIRVSNALVGFHKVSAFRTVALVGLIFLGIATAACYLAAVQLVRQLLPPVRAVRDIDVAAGLMLGPSSPVAADPSAPDSPVVTRVRQLAEPLNAAERAFGVLDEAS